MTQPDLFPLAEGYRRTHMTPEAALQYEDMYAEGTYDHWIWELEKACLPRLLRRHLTSRGEKIRLLDFACGTGRILSYLEPMVTEATGVDISPSMLALARPRVKGARLLRIDATRETVLPDRGYNLITAFRFFLNADGDLRDDALRVLWRALADDGIFVANIHGNFWSLRLATYLIRRYLLRQRINAISLGNMRHLLARHGFRVIEVKGLAWCTRSIYRLLGERWCSRIENALDTLPFLTHWSVNLVFVCKKMGRPAG